MKRILLVLWSIIFLCTLIIVLGGKVKVLGRVFMDTSTFYGDLYNECKLEDFRIPINLFEADHEKTPGQAKILCYGDSFLYTTLDSESFARVLEKTMDQPVFNTPRDAITSSTGSPLIFLENINFTKGEKKIMLVESIERYSPGYAAQYLKTAHFAGKTLVKQTVKLVYDNKDIEYFFRENIFILPLTKTIKNLKYRLLGEVDPKIEDVTSLNFDFKENIFAVIQSSWLDPRKIREFTIVGSEKMIVYDDTEPLYKIKIYDKNIKIPGHYDTFGEFQYAYHYGDVYIPHIKQTEPLRVECQQFLDSVTKGIPSPSNGKVGMQIVRILEAATESLKGEGKKIYL